jgi:hypothetical protein
MQYCVSPRGSFIAHTHPVQQSPELCVERHCLLLVALQLLLLRLQTLHQECMRLQQQHTQFMLVFFNNVPLR